MLSYIRQGKITPLPDRPWLALCFVLSAHLAVFATLRPHPQPLPVKTIPESIMINLLSVPQVSRRQQISPAAPIEKIQKPVKRSVKKTISQPFVPRIKQTNLPVVLPNEQTYISTAAVNSLSAEQIPKAADTQAYQSPRFNAAYLNNPAPHYPSLSRRLGEQGRVLLRVQVTTDGTAGSVELQTGSGSTRLDQAALEAVKKWRFIPAKRGEQPVNASVLVPVRFSIEG